MTVATNTTPTPDFVTPRRALLSVSDKKGLIELAHKLQIHGIELVSTGGTARALSEAGFDVMDVEELTGFPEIMDGRVKTLHPNVHGGLLAIRDNGTHKQAMQTHAIAAIDVLVVNLYPFETLSQTQADFVTLIENIDIGGPAMIRSAAKNHAYCAVVTKYQDYRELADELDRHQGRLSYDFRRHLAARAFARIADYDMAIANWFATEVNEVKGGEANTLPIWRGFGGARINGLRYGENPHQMAALYVDGNPRIGVTTSQMLQGKPLSYNNIADTDAAFELVSEFNPEHQGAVAIIKHANPCGVGVGENLYQAYMKALTCDPVSAFGGIIALNREIDAATAAEIVKIFTEVVIAPGVSEQARQILASKPNLRLLITGELSSLSDSNQLSLPDIVARSVAGGLLVQSRDRVKIEELNLRLVSKRAPTKVEMADLHFAFHVAKHVKSNAIVYARDGGTTGIGAGQMSRLDAARIGALKARDIARNSGHEIPTQGSVVASDAFFPFADGLLAVIETGATAVIQPGGSQRDGEVIDAANKHDVAMIFTGSRHFRH